MVQLLLLLHKNARFCLTRESENEIETHKDYVANLLHYLRVSFVAYASTATMRIYNNMLYTHLLYINILAYYAYRQAGGVLCVFCSFVAVFDVCLCWCVQGGSESRKIHAPRCCRRHRCLWCRNSRSQRTYVVVVLRACVPFFCRRRRGCRHAARVTSIGTTTERQNIKLQSVALVYLMTSWLVSVHQATRPVAHVFFNSSFLGLYHLLCFSYLLFFLMY